MQGVLLDLDGTLLDHEGAVTAALLRWLPTIGVTPDAPVLALWRTVQERHLADWRAGRLTFQQQRRRRVRDFLVAVGRPAEDDETRLDTLFGGFLRRYEQAWAPYPDAAPVLAALRRAGLRTAVLTNGIVAQQTDKLARIGLLDRVGPVYTGEALGLFKPDPAVFAEACRRWGLPPGAVVSVGDRHDLDVLPARAAGLRAVHLDRDGAGPLDEPDRVTSLRDLPALL
ncbi:HAD family hydrolase [Dactylosporangium aurantiacum]|uniref:HAD family hydrolase n=1 Tax=Dactylosporangium aurantiacum TaxID=35754 RepID=A0A9Q9IV57_9ACTN|nr:HAD family hydrolase [Dactylosporangium aurantiacum]